MEALRAEFPVLERLAYLNAGTNGPVPRRATEAAAAAMGAELEHGRGDARAMRALLIEPAETLRARLAALVGADPDELALTGSTTDGVNTVLGALPLGAGDELLTSDEEHPGVLAPLAAARARTGASIRVAPFGELAAAVGPRTRLVAASHVSWLSGRVLDVEALRAAGAPLLLDGAQALGAVPVDVAALGCEFYAAPLQKWLCGPNGLGCLYVRGDRVPELVPPAPGFMSLAAPERPLDFELRPSARRFDAGPPPASGLAWALAALDTLEAHGFARVFERAATLAAELAAKLAGTGRGPVPRGRTTLVSWPVADPASAVERMREHGFVLRSLPGRPWLRASVGAWSSEEELDRLVAESSA